MLIRKYGLNSRNLSGNISIVKLSNSKSYQMWCVILSFAKVSRVNFCLQLHRCCRPTCSVNDCYRLLLVRTCWCKYEVWCRIWIIMLKLLPHEPPAIVQFSQNMMRLFKTTDSRSERRSRETDNYSIIKARFPYTGVLTSP